MGQQGNRNKNKNKQIRPNQTTSLHNKGNHKRKWKVYGMRESICSQCNQQGLNFQKMQTAHNSTTQNKKSNKKQAQNLNRHFSKKDIPMDRNHTKRCPALLIIRKMQTKTTVRCLLTLVWKAIFKSTQKEGVYVHL